MQKAEIVVASAQLQPYTGDYWSNELGVMYRLGIADGKIKIVSVMDAAGIPRVNNFSSEMFRATGTDEFEVGKSGVTLRFQTDAGHAPGGFIMNAGRTKGLAFSRR